MVLRESWRNFSRAAWPQGIFALWLQRHVRKLLQWWLAAILTLLGFALAAAVARAEDVPAIQAHSKLSFAVYQGDEVNLEVRATGESLQAKWIRDKDTFCRDFRCTVRTSDWGLGSHKLTFVTYNNKGSLFLRFYVRVLPPPESYKPGKVEPELITQREQLEAVNADAMVTRATKGRGYSYHKRKVQVLGPRPRALEWSENLYTRQGAAIYLGKAGQEAHMLTENTSIELQQSTSGRRALRLKRGTLRSRMLSPQAPEWSILIGDWLQVDTDNLGDVIVERNAFTPNDINSDDDDDADDQESSDASASVKDTEAEDTKEEGKNIEVAEKSKTEKTETATITVLRGNVRVFHRSGGVEQALSQGSAFNLSAGQQAVFAMHEKQAPQTILPSSKPIAKLIRLTTPFYTSEKKLHEEALGETLLGAKQARSFKEALQLSEDAASNQDHFVVIEALQTFPKDVEKSYAASLSLGEAYAGVFLYPEAIKQLKRAVKLGKKSAQPRYLLGRTYLAEQKWQEAIKYFAQAEDLGFHDKSLLKYYSGVAKFRLNDRRSADRDFTDVIDAGQRPDLVESARKFLQQTKKPDWWNLRFGLNLIYDTNVLHAGSSALAGLENSPTQTKASGYGGSAGITAWFWNERSHHLGVEFDIEKTVYQGELKVIEPLKQKLGLLWGIATGGATEAKPYFALETNAGVGSIFVGEERAFDQLITGLSIGSPALLGLQLRVQNINSIDPLPERADVYDPILQEVVPAGDRSERQLYYGLGFSPIATRSFELGLHLERGKGTFRNPLHDTENYTDQKMGLAGIYSPSMDHRWQLSIETRQRRFAEALDQRSDKRSTYTLLWHMDYTTSLYHNITAEMQKQASTRTDNTYNRQAYAYQLGLNL